MRGERRDESMVELYEGFVGRELVLAEIDRCLLEDGVALVLTGGEGTGKTAILAAWLARREAVHELVPHHFAQRQQGDRVEPSMVVRSLAAQIEERYPALRDPFARPEARLVELLVRVSRELATPGGRMVLLFEGIDHGDLRDVLALLPRTLPPGIRLLCAARQRPGALAGFEERCVRLIHIDLDDPWFADDNEATVRTFWRREAAGFGLDDRFVERAVRCAAGNVLHAAALRRHVACVPQSALQLDAIPRDLPSLFALLWQRVSGDAAAVRALGLLCAAREPLSPAQLGRVAGWNDAADQRAVLHVARELVVATRHTDGGTTYRLFHHAIRDYLVQQLGPIAIRGHHHELADKLAAWPAPSGGGARRYALQHAVGHRIAARDCAAVHAIASNLDFLEAQCTELGVDTVELDLRRAREACLAAGQISLAGELDALARTIASESIALRHDAARAAQVWNRLRRPQVRPEPIAPRTPGIVESLALPEQPAATRAHPSRIAEQAPGMAGHPVTSSGRSDTINERAATIGGRAALLGGRPATSGGTAVTPGPTPARAGHARVHDLCGRGSGVTACAITPDGRLAVSATSDHMVHIWDLVTARLLEAFTWHTAVVTGCAITADGRRVVSASADTTLKVCDVRTRQVITLEGHADGVASCAITPDGSCVVSGSSDHTVRVWYPDDGIVTTFEGHTAAVTSCAVTANGRSVYSSSCDTTLRTWDAPSGHATTTLAGHAGVVTCCAVTPDGRRLVSGSSDRTLRVRHLDTGHVLTLAGHLAPVTGCAISSDGRSAYSASSDTTVKIWDTETGAVLATLEGHAGAVTCCAVTPDGRRLISGSSDGTIKVWDLDVRCSVRAPTGSASAIILPRPAGSAIAPRATRPVGKRTILFLAANPRTTSQLDLNQECSAIENELRAAQHGRDFEFHSKWAVTVDEMARSLFALKPTIIHFSGHCSGQLSDQAATCAREMPGDSGIYLHDEQHEAQLVTGRALASMIKSTAPSTRVVVLNACYSDGHAAALCQIVECVVGMIREIHDQAARSFAIGFYRALGYRTSIGEAVEHAKSTLACKGLDDERAPRCRTRNGADARKLHL